MGEDLKMYQHFNVRFCVTKYGLTKRCTGVAAGGFSVFRVSAGRNPVNAVVRC